MTELFQLDSFSSAASIVEHLGDAAPDKVAHEAVARLEARDFDGYVTFRQMLKDVEELLNQRKIAGNQTEVGHA